MLVAAGGKEGIGVWVPKVLPSFRVSVRARNSCQENAFLQHMKLKSLIDMAEKTFESVCLM